VAKRVGFPLGIRAWGTKFHVDPGEDWCFCEL